MTNFLVRLSRSRNHKIAYKRLSKGSSKRSSRRSSNLPEAQSTWTDAEKVGNTMMIEIELPKMDALCDREQAKTALQTWAKPDLLVKARGWQQNNQVIDEKNGARAQQYRITGQCGKTMQNLFIMAQNQNMSHYGMHLFQNAFMGTSHQHWIPL